MLQAMVDSPEEAEGWDAPQAERPPGSGGSMTSSTLHRILQVHVHVTCNGWDLYMGSAIPFMTPAVPFATVGLV